MIPVMYTTKVLSSGWLTSDMLELVLEKPAGFSFQAGQFVQFFIPDVAPQAVLRSYSIASAPSTETLLFCVKILPTEKQGKASVYLPGLKPGDVITFRGPEGRFVVAQNQELPKIFVATGSGIAPMRAMLADELSKPNNQSLHLLFGVRSQNDVFWKEEFGALAEKFKNFTFTLTLSQPVGAWLGNVGRVTDHLSELPSEADWYLCGSLPMVKDVRSMLTGRGVSSKQIHFEIF